MNRLTYKLDLPGSFRGPRSFYVSLFVVVSGAIPVTPSPVSLKSGQPEYEVIVFFRKPLQYLKERCWVPARDVFAKTLVRRFYRAYPGRPDPEAPPQGGVVSDTHRVTAPSSPPIQVGCGAHKRGSCFPPPPRATVCLAAVSSQQRWLLHPHLTYASPRQWGRQAAGLDRLRPPSANESGTFNHSSPHFPCP